MLKIVRLMIVTGFNYSYVRVQSGGQNYLRLASSSGFNINFEKKKWFQRYGVKRIDCTWLLNLTSCKYYHQLWYTWTKQIKGHQIMSYEV